MSVNIYTPRDTDTLAVDCRDVITVDDARYILERCLAAVRTRPACFLVDCSELSNLAPGVLNVLASYGDFIQHPNTRWLAFVTQSTFLKVSIQLLFGNIDLRFFDDREAASQFLQAVAD